MAQKIKWLFNSFFSDSIAFTGVDSVYLSYSTFNREKINGKYFDKYVDPLIYRDQSNGLKTLAMEFNQRGIKRKPKHLPKHQLGFILILKGLIYAKSRRFVNVSIELSADASKIARMYGVEQKVLEKTIFMSYFFYKYFQRKFKGTGVKKAYATAMTTSMSAGYFMAANSLGIETYEVQHGNVNPYNLNYTHISGALLEPTPSIFPKNFMFFSHWSIDNYKRYSPKGGLINYSFFGDLQGEYIGRILPSDLSGKFEKALSGFKKFVLVGLGRDDLENHICDQILKSSNDVLYSIRVHPGMTSNYIDFIQDSPNLTALLKSDRSNIDFEFAHSMPVEILLEKCDELWCGSSTLIISAFDLGKPVKCWDAFAIEYYGTNRLESFEKN
ncbi:hypothetical protein [uncultured Roseivirga sp.]|uniref:hypothetical protein n=1 Tax=uncultured Roseivirga sp. TaxID=543088 RepID=UPI00258F5FE8|nr:hypothetical protein [uncultured Roseivirga sp.]